MAAEVRSLDGYRLSRHLTASAASNMSSADAHDCYRRPTHDPATAWSLLDAAADIVQELPSYHILRLMSVCRHRLKEL